MEKNITLAVTLKVGKIFSDSIRNVQIIYTRTTDDYPSLVDRHEMANKANADLFVAIHVNSTPFTYTKVLEGFAELRKNLNSGRYTVSETASVLYDNFGNPIPIAN